jgi:hypothetical protein
MKEMAQLVMQIDRSPRNDGTSGAEVSPGIFSDSGNWSVGASNWIAVHEAGHLFGFPDYYTGTGTALPGWEGTVMNGYGGTVTKPGPNGKSFRDMLIDNALEEADRRKHYNEYPNCFIP